MIGIPEAELRRAPPSGYQLKVFARDGSDVLITIPQAAIEKLLAKLHKPTPKV
jgi:hypothetical protein